MEEFHPIFDYFLHNGLNHFSIPYPTKFFHFSDTGVPVQSNELLHLLKSVFCVVIPTYTDDEIIQVILLLIILIR